MFHVSSVTCHMSPVTCHPSHVIFLSLEKLDKVVVLVSSMSSKGGKKGDRALIEGETNSFGKQEMELALYLSGQ